MPTCIDDVDTSALIESEAREFGRDVCVRNRTDQPLAALAEGAVLFIMETIDLK